MARYSGKIGYNLGTIENPEGSGIWKETIVERPYFGDIEWSNRRYDHQKVNNDVSVNNSISVVADAFANDNFFNIVYVTWQGRRWKMQSVEVKHPRLIIYIGGLYDGETA